MADLRRCLGATNLGQPQSRAVVCPGSLGGGVLPAHVAGFKSVVDPPAQAAIHAVSLAMAAVFGNSIYFTNRARSAELDRAGGALSREPVRARFCRATFPAALVGQRC